jgi:hypothetical protein
MSIRETIMAEHKFETVRQPEPNKRGLVLTARPGGEGWQ